jgi:hypothetical protein
MDANYDLSSFYAMFLPHYIRSVQAFMLMAQQKSAEDAARGEPSSLIKMEESEDTSGKTDCAGLDLLTIKDLASEKMRRKMLFFN